MVETQLKTAFQPKTLSSIKTLKMTLNKIAKNNLMLLIQWFIINGLASIIALINGMENSVIVLLVFIGGQIVGMLFISNIQGKKSFSTLLRAKEHNSSSKKECSFCKGKSVNIISQEGNNLGKTKCPKCSPS